MKDQPKRKKNKKKDWCWFVLAAIILLGIPFLLNWLIQRKAFTSVIGDESTWLSFWGTYIGAILTGIMVLATFITIRKTVNINKTQWKINWLNSFRGAASDLVLATDATMLGRIAQYVEFGQYDVATEKGHTMEQKLKRSSFLLMSLLKEYNDVFEDKDGEEYVKKVNAYIEPFLQCTSEIIQFAFICNFLFEKIKAEKESEGVMAIYNMKDEMKKNGNDLIVQAIQDLHDGDALDDVIHDAIVLMQNKASQLDSQGIEELLTQIGQQQSKKTYHYVFMVYGKEKKVDNTSSLDSSL